MTTLREQAVAAVVERLAAVGTLTVTRNELAPATIESGGYVVIRDGSSEEVDRTLGITSYWITHRVSVEAIVGGGDPSGALDECAGDRGGAGHRSAAGARRDLRRVRPGRRRDNSADGAETFKAALFDVLIEYETSNSLA